MNIAFRQNRFILGAVKLTPTQHLHAELWIPDTASRHKWMVKTQVKIGRGKTVVSLLIYYKINPNANDTQSVNIVLTYYHCNTKNYLNTTLVLPYRYTTVIVQSPEMCSTW